MIPILLFCNANTIEKQYDIEFPKMKPDETKINQNLVLSLLSFITRVTSQSRRSNQAVVTLENLAHRPASAIS